MRNIGFQQSSSNKNGYQYHHHLQCIFYPLFKDCLLLKVPGKSRLLAMIKPAVEEMTSANISSVPCVQITIMEFSPIPFAKNIY